MRACVGAHARACVRETVYACLRVRVCVRVCVCVCSRRTYLSTSVKTSIALLSLCEIFTFRIFRSSCVFWFFCEGGGGKYFPTSESS
jgi:hypothetical protein